MNARKSRIAFTLIELLVVVAIVALLISILLPSLSAARENARLARCGAQLRQLGVAIHAYAAENRGMIPRGPDPLNPFDLVSSAFATNQVWIGAEPWFAPHNYSRTSLGVLQTARVLTDPAALYCPADDHFSAAEEAVKIESPASAYCSYIYRQLDHLPVRHRDGRLDSLGVNEVGDPLEAVPVAALALDANSLGEDEARHTNHRAIRANILFRDSSVRALPNRNESLAIPAAAIENFSLLPLAIDQLLSNADFAFVAGAPWRGPKLLPQP